MGKDQTREVSSYKKKKITKARLGIAQQAFITAF